MAESSDRTAHFKAAHLRFGYSMVSVLRVPSRVHLSYWEVFEVHMIRTCRPMRKHTAAVKEEIDFLN